MKYGGGDSSLLGSLEQKGFGSLKKEVASHSSWYVLEQKEQSLILAIQDGGHDWIKSLEASLDSCFDQGLIVFLLHLYGGKQCTGFD